MEEKYFLMSEDVVTSSRNRGQKPEFDSGIDGSLFDEELSNNNQSRNIKKSEFPNEEREALSPTLSRVGSKNSRNSSPVKDLREIFKLDEWRKEQSPKNEVRNINLSESFNPGRDKKKLLGKRSPKEEMVGNEKAKNSGKLKKIKRDSVSNALDENTSTPNTNMIEKFESFKIDLKKKIKGISKKQKVETMKTEIMQMNRECRRPGDDFEINIYNYRDVVRDLTIDYEKLYKNCKIETNELNYPNIIIFLMLIVYDPTNIYDIKIGKENLEIKWSNRPDFAFKSLIRICFENESEEKKKKNLMIYWIF